MDPHSTRAELLHCLPGSPPAGRILVIRLGAIGDVVRTRFALPGLRALYPEARIDWLVEDRAASGLDGTTGLDDIVRVPRRTLSRGPTRATFGALRQLIRTLRERRYDLSVDFHGILKSGLLARAAGIPVRVGYGRGVAREWGWRFLTDRASLVDRRVSRFERNAALVRFLGGEVPATPPAVEIPASVERDLADVPDGLFAIHPGTSATTLYKRWEASGYAEVARRLRQDWGSDSLVTWGPVRGEREIAEEVVRLSGGAARLAPATASIQHVLALYRRTRLYVGGDSGPMHLASLARRPVVALFGPTDPVENAPFPGLPARVVRRDVGCNPCREGCPARVCMRSIEVEEVVHAVAELLQEAPADTRHDQA
jgi:heptosyltransferase-1